MTADNNVSKNWELTLYELHRKPQEPITDGTVIAISPRSLKSELMCPICLDILKVTMTTKECLHRFCSECIITALRSGNKECPTCRKKLVSKRSLRRDPNFDALISKIYPSRHEYEAHQDKILARLNRQHLSATLTRSLEQQLGLGGNRIRNSINGRSISNMNSMGVLGSNDVGISEEETNNFRTGITDSESRRRLHLNSDVESGMETNSVGESSSISDLPVRNANDPNSQCPPTTIPTTAHTNPILSTPISYPNTISNMNNNNNNNNHDPNDGIFSDNNIAQNNITHTSSVTISSPVFPEIEVLLKPYPKYNQYVASSSSPLALSNRNNSIAVTNNNNNNNNNTNINSNGNLANHERINGPVKYLKAPTITTVDHLCRYLTVRINLQRMNPEVTGDSVHFNLYSLNELTNTFSLLDSHMSIDEISRNLFQGANCLDLYYARDDLEEI